jgi:heme A synthase
MGEVHRIVGFVVVAVFTVGWVWAGLAFLLRRDPGPLFWTWLVVAQAVAGLQALIGLLLLVTGRPVPDTLHLVYGFGPLVILLLGHLLARELGKGRGGEPAVQPWAVFGFASFICFGLSLRALMTGLGIG